MKPRKTHSLNAESAAMGALVLTKLPGRKAPSGWAPAPHKKTRIPPLVALREADADANADADEDAEAKGGAEADATAEPAESAESAETIEAVVLARRLRVMRKRPVRLLAVLVEETVERAEAEMPGGGRATAVGICQ